MPGCLSNFPAILAFNLDTRDKIDLYLPQVAFNKVLSYTHRKEGGQGKGQCRRISGSSRLA